MSWGLWGLHTAGEQPLAFPPDAARWLPKRTTLHRGIGLDYRGGELPSHIRQAIHESIRTGQPNIEAAHQLLDHIGPVGKYWTSSPEVATHFAENESTYGSKLHVMLSGDHQDGLGIDHDWEDGNAEEDDFDPYLEGEDETRIHTGTPINVHTVQVKHAGSGPWTTLMSDFPHERHAAVERDVAEDLMKLAGKFGDLPEGLIFTHGKDYTGRDVVNAHLGDKHVGQLTWTNSDKWGHDINYITVHPEYRRRGVGTAILHHIRENIDPKITHSNNVTPAGKGFAKADGFKPPPYFNGEKGRFEMDPVRDDSNEWPDAAVGNGMKWDDNFWKGKNKDRFARTAMPNPLPQGVHFRYHPELVWSPGVTAHYKGKQIGSLEWYDDDHVMVDLGSRKPGEIDRISVHPKHQGNSVATKMFDFAKQYEPRLHHSEQLTDDGRGWSEYEKARNARLAAVTQGLVDRLDGEFNDWMEAQPAVNFPRWGIGHWPNIEKFLGDKYPAAHRGLGMGMEEAQPLIDQTPHGLYGDRMPQGHDPYQTGSGAEAEYGYDPKEIASGMLFLHNRSYGLGRMDLQETDENRLNDIAQKRYQMQRDYESRTAANWRNSLDDGLDPDELVTLYHRTDRSSANRIMQTQSWIPNEERGDYDAPLGSHQTDQHIYFALRPGGDKSYGPSVVSTQVPRGAIKRDQTQFWGGPGGKNDPQWVRVHMNDLAGRPVVRERPR